MFKTIAALFAAAIFSMDASAGYVQYNLNGPLGGTVIQHDTDQSIAYFNLDLFIDGTPRPFKMNLSATQFGEGSTQLTHATTFFRGSGPSNFGIRSNFGADQLTYLNVIFTRGAEGIYHYTARYTSSIYFHDGYQDFAGQHIGTTTAGVVNPSLARELDENGGYYYNLNRITPTFIDLNEVPEPGSIALLAIGAVGLLNMRRRRQA